MVVRESAFEPQAPTQRERERGCDRGEERLRANTIGSESARDTCQARHARAEISLSKKAEISVSAKAFYVVKVLYIAP